MTTVTATTPSQKLLVERGPWNSIQKVYEKNAYEKIVHWK